MSQEFVQTQMTILRQLAVEKTGGDEAAWSRFFELYYPAMVAFATRVGACESAEDVVQGVLVKLVSVLREGRYEHQQQGSFRGYLKTLIRNSLNDLFRREKARGYGRKVELNEAVTESVASDDRAVGAALDDEWAQACREAAVEHVLQKTAMSPQSKAIYLAYVLEGRPIGEVAKSFGVPKNSVSQVKTRVERMIAAKMSEYAD